MPRKKPVKAAKKALHRESAVTAAIPNVPPMNTPAEHWAGMRQPGNSASRSVILDMIDESTVPARMTPEQAIQFLDELIGDLRDRIETLHEENPDIEG